MSLNTCKSSYMSIKRFYTITSKPGKEHEQANNTHTLQVTNKHVRMFLLLLARKYKKSQQRDNVFTGLAM